MPPVYWAYAVGVSANERGDGERRRGRAYVAEVGVGRVDLRAVLLVEGHAPEAVVLAEAGGVELVPEGVRVLRESRISLHMLVRYGRDVR